ncbi:MAG TPA: hypothetical protein VGA87_02825 [Pyrinomonadaceae bacterium]|jgi:hypothetical protein
MNKPDWRLNGMALITGLILVPGRFFLMFFPLFNLTEMILYGAAAALLAYCFRVGPSWWVALLFLPLFLALLYIIMHWFGIDNVRQGTGTGHAVSLVLIPLAILVGAYCGSKLASSNFKIRV